MKKLLSFVAVLAMALVVVAAADAKAATYYFDNTNTQWEEVAVWSWVTEGEDAMYEMNQGLTAWPGIKLEKDAATGYYVWEQGESTATKFAVMFNNNVAEGAEQTCDALATSGADGKVCVPTVKNTADDAAADETRKEGQWFGEWIDLPNSGNGGDADGDDTAAGDDTTAGDDTAAGDDVVTGDGDKDNTPATGDVAPIAVVAVLAVASMAVVVATRKRMA